jgi:hypothetical protein
MRRRWLGDPVAALIVELRSNCRKEKPSNARAFSFSWRGLLSRVSASKGLDGARARDA